jgi:4,5-DOPA dioxygenase extradiol
MSDRLPALFLGHGSPMNTLEDNEFSRSWTALGRRLPQPRAVLCLSAHWETDGLRVTAAAAPETIHDFYGVPDALFRFQYAAPGAPALAARVAALTGAAEDPTRGLDHGAWSVLCRLYPQAEVPVIQLSLDRRRAPADFLALGRQLAPLRAEGVLLLGSGNLVHNLGILDREREGGFPWADDFAARTRALILAGDADALADWPSLGPAAALAVPTAEHYLPLLPILGARAPDESVEFLTERIVLGSIGMTSVVFGGTTLRA